MWTACGPSFVYAYLFIWLRFFLIFIFYYFLNYLIILFFIIFYFIYLFGSAVAHGLSWSEVCGILVPRPGVKLACSELQGGFLTTGPSGKSLAYLSGRDGKEHIGQTCDPLLCIRGCVYQLQPWHHIWHKSCNLALLLGEVYSSPQSSPRLSLGFVENTLVSSPFTGD